MRHESQNRSDGDLPTTIVPEQAIEIVVDLDFFIANGGLNITR
jgi:hypothetical protein